MSRSRSLAGDVLEVDQAGQVDLQLGVAEPGRVAQCPSGEPALVGGD